MIKINDLNCLGNEARAVTFGKFDGIHLGHQKLMREICEKEKQGLLSTVFTFDRLSNSLLSLSERESFLADFGINTLFEYRVTKKNMSVAADEFVNNIIKDSLNAKFIAVGEDFHFGYNRQGDVRLLNKMAKSCGYELLVVEKEQMDDEAISSSRIKSCLEDGNIEDANKMLGYSYYIQGEIVKGNQLGRTWNIPTINVVWPDNKVIPKFGVYYSEVCIEGRKYYGMTNVGIKPSIEGNYKPLSETFLYDCNENLYGKVAKVKLLHFRRSEQKFESIEKLISQLHEDIDAGRSFVL